MERLFAFQLGKSTLVDNFFALIANRFNITARTLYGVATGHDEGGQQGQDDNSESGHDMSSIISGGEYDPTRFEGGGGNTRRVNFSEQRCGGAIIAARKENGREGQEFPLETRQCNYFWKRRKFNAISVRYVVTLSLGRSPRRGRAMPEIPCYP